MFTSLRVPVSRVDTGGGGARRVTSRPCAPMRAADIVAIEVFNTARERGPLNRMRVRRLAAMLGVCGVVAGCTTTTLRGTTEPADPAGPTSATTTSPTPALVPAAGIRAKLLKRDELASIVGDTGMKDTGDCTKPDEALLSKFDPDDCAPRLLVGVGEGYFKQAAFVENVNQGARAQVADQQRFVAELLIVVNADGDSRLPRPAGLPDRAEGGPGGAGLVGAATLPC
jgi:hypothetical protein